MASINGGRQVAGGFEMNYPVLNSREWHALSVKDKLISIILNAGHSLGEIDMKQIEDISSRWDKPLEPPSK